MKVFHCDHCSHLLFFENTHCLACGHRAAYLPELGLIGSLDPLEPSVLLWRSPLARAEGLTYRLCQNYAQHDVCNWAIASDDDNPLCISCRLTRITPQLTHPDVRQAWYRLEMAKRRLVYTLLNARLPVRSLDDDPGRGLAFEFNADGGEGAPPVLTGHANGVVTINLAEADDAERERRRTMLREPYRTLLGHMRHESGHYYWTRLIEGVHVEEFRAMFGDERQDYQQALQKHYENGAPADWQARFVSAYASAHPWEDWAETWAHYLHMIDTTEMASACGLSLQPARRDEPSLQTLPPAGSSADVPFDLLIKNWFSITYVVNNLNRGLGLADAYPFVLSTPAVDKLRFVNAVVTGRSVPGGVRWRFRASGPVHRGGSDHGRTRGARRRRSCRPPSRRAGRPGHPRARSESL